MHIDIETFDASKSIVLNWFDSKGGKDVSRTIGMMEGITFVPCIVIAYWLGEHTKWQDPQCEKSIKSLIDFYGYSKITGKPEGSPL